MKILSVMTFFSTAALCFAGEDAFQKALETASSVVERTPLAYQVSMWTSDLQGQPQSRMDGEVQYESESRFRLSFTMEGPYQEATQKSEGMILSDGTFGWRESREQGTAFSVVKSKTEGLIDAKRDSFVIFISLAKFLEAIAKLDEGALTRTGEVLTKGTEINAAFVNHIPLFKNEGDMVGQPIEISLNAAQGFPLILKFHVEEKLFALIRFGEVVPLDQKAMDRALDYQLPEGIKVLDQTQNP